jgi:predicted nucleotidyltransferase
MRFLVLNMRVDQERMLSGAEIRTVVAATSTAIQVGDSSGGTILDAHGEPLGTYDLVDETPAVPWDENPANPDRPEVMNTNELVEIIARRLHEAAPDAKVILFGSRSRGHERPGSDVDLLVIEPVEVDRPRAESARLRKALSGLGVGIDLILVWRKHAEERGRMAGSMLNEALTGGRVLIDPPEFSWDEDPSAPADDEA